MKSIWQETAQKPEFGTLKGNIQTDVLIIGGGIAGLMCGYMLKEAGVKCVIAEAKTICSGVTANTTAKVTYHHGAIFDKMIKTHGLIKSRLYVQAHKEALDKIRELSQHIDCDLEDATSYVYSRTDKEKIIKEVVALNKLGCDAKFTTKTELPFPVAGAVSVKDQAQFNPLRFAYGLAKDLKIFENTEVLGIRDGSAITKRGIIKAKKIIVTTHFPFLNKHGLYFMKLYQHRSYVLALENAPAVRGMYVDESDKGLSFRSYGDLLLLGGGGHRTGKDGGGWRELEEFAKVNFPDAKQVCHFATQDCKPLDDIAYIGRYSRCTPDLYVATGFNKWGMTSAMVAANILCDLVRGKENKYAIVFSPLRCMLHKQLFVNAGESVLGLITPTKPRCTHLGCALKYNKQEHTWDCGCHGSRFTSDGRVIDNPAMKNIKLK